MTKASIQMHKGVPTLMLDGKPHSAFAYMSYNLQAKYVREFADAGVDIFSFSISPDYDYYRFSNDGWKGPEQYSYVDFDKRMKIILDACPHARIFPRVYLCTPPRWDKKHPEELMAGPDGPYDPKPDFGWLPKEVNEIDLGLAKMTVPSFSSKQWLKDSGDALKRFIKHAEEKFGESIIGYHIVSGGTQEWYYWGAFEDIFPDYSKPQQEAFKEWLDKKGIPHSDENPVPSVDIRKHSEFGMFRDPTTREGQLAVEYWRFHAWALVHAMSHFCQVTRDIIGPDKFIGVFYGYFVDLQRHATCWHNSGHLAFRQMLLDPNINFVTSPTSYKDRKMGGYSIFNSLTESLVLHNKLWWNENDILTPLAPVPKGDLFYMPKTMLESRHIQRREFANVLCHGSSMWWFDMFAGWFSDKQTMTDIATMAKIGRKAVHLDRNSAAEIAVVVDDESIFHTECNNQMTVPLISDQLMELGHTGAPFSMVHVDDIPELQNYKFYIFLNLFYVDKKRLAAIRKCIRKPGITSLFIYAPGIVGDAISSARMGELTGIQLYAEPLENQIRISISGTGDLPAVEYGIESPISPTIYSIDKKSEILGMIKGTGKAGLVRKKIGESTSIFSSAPRIPTDVLRSLLKNAGCHLFVEKGEVVYANKSFLSVCTLPGETPILNLPADGMLFNLFTDEELKVIDDRIALPPSDDGTWIFFRGSRKEWGSVDKSV